MKKYNILILVIFLIIGFIFIFIPKTKLLNYKHIININKEISNITNNSTLTDRGARILNSDDAEKIHELQNKKEDLVKKNFKNRDRNKGNFMILTGDSTISIENKLTDIEKKVIEEEIYNVVNNIEIDDRYIEDITFIVSPYELTGINGFTLSKKGNNKLDQFIVISYSSRFLEHGGDTHRESIRSTILHELGHSYKNRLENEEGKSFDRNYRKYYSEIKLDSKSENEVLEWKNSENENFAEDFKVYYSNKLGEFSFISNSKKTSLPYNENIRGLLETYNMIN